ncbi:MAG: anthranilate synthase component II, partial [Alphaproteobacteria bacterium]
GVCLGHQAIAQAYGATIARAPTLMHGKLSPIRHDGDGVFRGINRPFVATRYHSLTIAPDTMPDTMIVNARTDDGIIMGARHVDHPVHGVQFHPESIASEHGHTLLRNFLDIAGDFNTRTGRLAA